MDVADALIRQANDKDAKAAAQFRKNEKSKELSSATASAKAADSRLSAAEKTVASMNGKVPHHTTPRRTVGCLYPPCHHATCIISFLWWYVCVWSRFYDAFWFTITPQHHNSLVQQTCVLDVSSPYTSL